MSAKSINSIGKLNLPMIKQLLIKDWQLFEKQLAAFVSAGIFALCLIGNAKPVTFYLGSLLLIIILVASACFSISSSLVNERKEQTLSFVMSLPITPLDYYLSKLMGSAITFAVPLLVMMLGSALVIYVTPLPNGLLLLAVLLFAQITLAFCLSLSVAMAVESEGWNIFVMIASMTMINPFIMWIGQIPAIAVPMKSEHLVWSWQALSILSVQLGLSVIILLWTGWYHCRKRAFY